VPKAITTAAVYQLARIVYGQVKHGWEDVKKAEEQYAAAVRERLEKSLHKKAKDLGCELVKAVAPPVEAEPAPLPA
jgi:hypothetical protein